MKKEKLLQDLACQAGFIIERINGVGFSEEVIKDEFERFAKIVKSGLTEFVVENTPAPKISYTLWDFVESDKKEVKIRPILGCIYHDPDGFKVATNCHSLIAVKAEVTEEQAGKAFNKAGEVVEGKYPMWARVIPVPSNETITEFTMRTDLDEAIKNCAAHEKLHKDDECIIEIDHSLYVHPRYAKQMLSLLSVNGLKWGRRNSALIVARTDDDSVRAVFCPIIRQDYHEVF